MWSRLSSALASNLPTSFRWPFAASAASFWPSSRPGSSHSFSWPWCHSSPRLHFVCSSWSKSTRWPSSPRTASRARSRKKCLARFAPWFRLAQWNGRQINTIGVYSMQKICEYKYMIWSKIKWILYELNYVIKQGSLRKASLPASFSASRWASSTACSASPSSMAPIWRAPTVSTLKRATSFARCLPS